MKHRVCCLLLAGVAVALPVSVTAVVEVAATPQGPKLERAVPFTARDGLPNVAAKLKAGAAVNVVFLGGSITVGAESPKGYVTFVADWLKARYPKARVKVVNAGISGTGSDFGDRRYDRDVLSKNPDLVLIEFCVNDGDNNRTESMERMVHKTWLKNPKTDLVFFLHAGEAPPRQLQGRFAAAVCQRPRAGRSLLRDSQFGHGVQRRIENNIWRDSVADFFA